MKFVKRLFLILFIILIISCALIIKSGYNLYKDAIAKAPLEQEIASIQNSSNFVKLDDISKDFTNALLAIEDHRFYEHGPIDLISIFRAVAKDIKELKLAEGGSTITQQFAKNLYFTQEKKFSRKIAEVFIAYDLEKKYKKDDILELYINTVYFGDGHYGILDASKGYFDKLPKELNFNEATMLAGLPNAPSVYALSNNSDLSDKRRQQVIDAMVKFEYITYEEVNSKITE